MPNKKISQLTEVTPIGTDVIPVVNNGETKKSQIANLPISKSQVGLGNVDNTSDANKPISSATQTALNGKQATLTNNSIQDSWLSSNVTLQGNTFNGASQLVQLDASAKLPAVDGSQLTNIAWGNISSKPTTLGGYGITDAVPSSRILTINGTAYDLSADRSWTISTATPTLNQVIVAGNSTNASFSASGAIARGVYFNNTLVASANNDVLVGIDINPTFTNGAFTGVSNYALRTQTGKIIHQGLTNATHSSQVYYNTSTGELTYGALPTVATPTLAQVTTAGNTTTNSITVGKIISKGLGDVITIDSTTLGSRATLKLISDSGSYTQLVGNGTEFNMVTLGTTPLTFGTNSAERMRIFANGNVAINTTTDAGYKLDVNGTMRVSGNLTVSRLVSYYGASNAQPIYIHTLTYLLFESGGPENNNINKIDIRHNFVGSNFNGIAIQPTINQTIYSGITRGIYINPTLTSAYDFRAIDIQAGSLVLGRMNADPSNATNGMIYYNTTTNKFRGYENGAWANLI